MSRKRHVVLPGYTPYLLVALVASSCQVLSDENLTSATESETIASTFATQTTVPKASDKNNTSTNESEPATSTPTTQTSITEEPGKNVTSTNESEPVTSTWTAQTSITEAPGKNVTSTNESEPVTSTWTAQTNITEAPGKSVTSTNVSEPVTSTPTTQTTITEALESTTERSTVPGHVTTTDIPVPRSPTNLNSTALNSSAVRLEWSPVYEADGYIIQWQVQNDTNNVNNETNIGENETDIVIGGLQIWTQYNFSVSATREDKVSDPAITTARTHPTEPCSPVNVIYKQPDFTKLRPVLRIRWKKPTCTNGPLDGYIVSWKKKGDKNNEIFVNRSSDSYDIIEPSPWTEYTISVFAFNRVGYRLLKSAENKINLRTPPAAPGPPLDLTLDYSETEINATWRPPNPTNGIITGYNISIAEGHCKADPRNKKWQTTSETAYSNTSLIAATNYSFSVYAFIEWNGIVLTGSVGCKNFTTHEGIPSAPSGLRCVESSNSTITISFEEPVPTRGKIIGYTICYCILLDCNKRDSVFRTSTLSGLQLDTEYEIKVAAWTSKGKGTWSSSTSCRTKAAVPNPPTRVHAPEVTTTRATIVWTAPQPYPGRTTYHVNVHKLNTSCENSLEFVTSEKTEMHQEEIEGLEPYTTYGVDVFAETEAGRSINSSTNLTTMPTVPEAVTHLTLNCSFSTTTISLSWCPPSKPNGLITRYHIHYKGKKGDKEYEDRVFIDVAKPCISASHTLKKLVPEYRYTFYVSAQVAGVRELSEPVEETCTLAAGLPPPPRKNISVIESLQKKIKFVIQNDTFLETEGEIVEYAVVVAEAKNIGSNESKLTKREHDKLSNWSEFQKNDSLRYRATPDEWNPFSGKEDDPLKCKFESNGVTCILGCQVGCDVKTYCNGPLTPGMSYGIKLRGYTRAGFAETFPVVANTTSESVSSFSNILTIIFVTALLLFVVAAAVFMYRRWGTGRTNNLIVRLSPRRFLKSTMWSRTTPTSNDGVCATSDINSTRPVKLSEYSTHVNNMIADSRLKFSMEFEELKKLSPLHPFTAAQLPDNRPKNRWVNILPYDHSRVKLLPVDDEPASDYINASYVPGFTCHREYIASQGPLPGTVDDMWRMIWEQGVNTIVMLTQCVERGKAKCQQYWPEEKQSATYGDLQVQTMCQSVLSEYTIRSFDVSLGNRHRIVTQMHFTKWPDFGCPDNTELLINFVRAVRDHITEANGSPLLIHCSAGVGRTGTFIAVDRLMQHIVLHEYVDVFHTVFDMREHRTNMVQTEDQYVYIHECVRDLVQEKLARERDSLKDDHIYGNICMQATTNV